MTIEEFRKIKEEIAILFKEADSYGSTITEEQEINFVNRYTEVVNRYTEVVNKLLSSDLSNIPFEEWNGLDLFPAYGDTLDFSKTHANLDFKIFKCSSINGVNLSGCNIRNIDYIYSHHILLSDEVLSEDDFDNINELIDTSIDEDSRKSIFSYVTETLNGNFDSYFLLKSNYPDIAKIVEPKIKQFYFPNFKHFHYIYRTLGIKLLFEVINLYGINTLNDSFTSTRDFDDFFENINDNNYISLINANIFNTIVDDKVVDIRTLPDVFVKEYNYLFLPEDAPEDLKELYYKGYSSKGEKFDFSVFRNHPDWISYMKEIKFIYMFDSDSRRNCLNLQRIMNDDDIFDLLINYGYYIIYWPIPSDCNDKKQTLNYIIGCMKKSAFHPNADFLNYPDDFKNRVKEYYLDDNAPEELKKKFYSKRLTVSDFINNPEYINYFDDKCLMVGFPTKFYWIMSLNYTSSRDQLKILTMLDKYNNNSYRDLICSYLEDHFEDKIDDIYSKLLLPDEAPEELKNKFYSQTLYIHDFEEHPEYLSYFNNTVLGLGFDYNYSNWIIKLYPKDNIMQYKILSACEKISDDEFSNILENYLTNKKDTFDVNKFDLFIKLVSILSFSNSSEIRNFRCEIAEQLLSTTDPGKSLYKLEKAFIENNLPIIGKIYSAFKILHPNLEGFDFNKETSKCSPQLLNRNTFSKEIIIFSDLIKCAVGSNNRSLRDYIKLLKNGNKIYENICNGVISLESLSDDEYNILTSFYNHLYMLYDNTLIGKNNTSEFGTDIIQNISKLKMLLSPEKGMNYNLADRCVEIFCHFAGFDTVEDLEKTMNDVITYADTKHRKDTVLHEPVTLNKGDFVKGIDGCFYLGRILQNGSVAKEFLGPSACSDQTPLDTDLALIPDETTIEDGIKGSLAKNYGPIYLILRNDDRFIDSRPLGKDIDTTYDPNKYECFSTLSEYHYGIRTGFASSDIDYIVVGADFRDEIALEIVMNGFYIPVVNLKGEIVFTPQMYDEMKEKMQGLSYYDSNTYKFSNSLQSPEVFEIANQVKDNNKATRYKRIKIEKAIGEVLSTFGITLKTKIDGDLTTGSAELIDIGSTSRGTNEIGEGDFDFMFRLDRSFFLDSDKLEELQDALYNKFESYGHIEYVDETSCGVFRFKGVTIEDVKVDIDLSFDAKNDEITYSTDRCLQDRLETIEKIDPEKYTLVCANIILAKKVLKEAGVYKSSHSKPAQGGLGGVGVENWILQHGGSFEDAAKSFLEAAENTSFEDFVKKYQVFDFGENHFSVKNDRYSHDNFVRNNMNASGYEKMKEALINYLNKNKVEVETIDTSEEHIEDFAFDNNTEGRS